MSEKLLRPVDLLDGVYRGSISGDELLFGYQGLLCEKKLHRAITNKHIPVTFVVKQGEIDEASIRAVDLSKPLNWV